MKHIFKVFFSFLLLFQFGAVSAQQQIPAKLQGYWQFKVNTKGNWDGMNIGKNYVEYFYDLMMLDSIRQSDKEYTLYLTHKKNGACTIKVALNASDSAVFSIPEKQFVKACKHFVRNPDIEYLDQPEYSKLIDGKWMANFNTNQPLGIEKGKLLYEGKRWNICWLGSYLKREYRALIENKGSYRLIYLMKDSNKAWKLTYNSTATIYCSMPSNVDKHSILGNWYEPLKNEWTYGFFEKFVVYKGKYWEYKSQNIKKNKGTINLQNGDKTVQLAFNKTNDSTLQISLDNETAITYTKAKRTLPHFKAADTKRFADNHFASVDTAYISGYLPNRRFARPFEVSFHDMIIDEQVTYYGEVDSLGRFEVKVPLYNSTMVFLDWKQIQLYDVLEPNEHYFLYYDASTKQTLIMGDNARIHNELAAFNFWGIPRSSRQTGIKPLEFFTLKREEYNKAKNYTNRTLAQMPNPSERLRYFFSNYNKYEIAFDLMQYRFELNRQKNEKFPDEYIAYVRDSLFPNPPSPITLNRSFFPFIRDYVGYFKSQKGSQILTSHEVVVEMAKNGKLKLDQSDKDLMMLVGNFYEELQNVKDTADFKKMKFRLTSKDNDRFDAIYKQNKEQISIEQSRMFSEMSLKNEFEALNACVTNEMICDYYIACLLYKNLNDNRKPIENELFNNLITRVKTPIFRDKIIATQKFYTELSGKSIEYTQSLKNTSHLKEAKDADALWKELIAPYKGKIIYADFWGTWCGPCKMEMAYVADLKKQFIGKDVMFMYFANNSPEESWKNVIKSYSLTGENVVQYRLPDEQQALLERRFGVKHYPTYLMIDKNGNVVDTNPPRPSANETTIDYLKGWLEKK